MGDGMRIVYVYADSPQEWNCSEWRCAVPARAINRTGRHQADLINIEDFAYHRPPAEEACAAADVLVVQRNLFGPVLQAIQYWKSRDKVLIADFDDAYDRMHPSVANAQFWGQGLVVRGGKVVNKIQPPPIEQFKWGLRLVHAATAPSRILAQDWQAYTTMLYLPNYIDLSRYENTTHNQHDGVILGWGGSISHLQSFTGSGILAALKRVCKARPQVKVMIAGSDRRILQQLPLPAKQIIHHPWTPYHEWSQVLANFDIGLAPLDGDYDERRSWIKVLEYMLLKIPFIASEGPAYQELRPYGWLVNNTANAWERVLLDMIDHLEDYRQEAAVAPYMYALAQNIDEHVDELLKIYNSVQNELRTTSQSLPQNKSALHSVLASQVASKRAHEPEKIHLTGGSL
jgi:glycosyltransferase involved in cell wall biosynthesis